MHRFLLFLTWFFVAIPASAETYYVSADGGDTAQRNGRSAETAWKTLAFACEQIPTGDHEIQIGAGEFVVYETAQLKSGWKVQGTPGKTIFIASTDWKLSENPLEGDSTDEYLIAAIKCENVKISDVTLASKTEHRVTGGLYCRGCENIEIANLNVREFRWAGIAVEHSSKINLHHCSLHNASTEKFRYHNGLIQTRWLKHSEIHHNRVTSDIGGGYGYKAGGHEKVRIHHNYFEVVSGFAIESAHENEYGVEIDHNYANRCISIPKGGQGGDPNSRDCPFSFDIHHNLLTDSYTVEGPRNHLRLHHNYIRIEKTGGRVYTHHGGINHGPFISTTTLWKMSTALSCG